jgi:hypothetical protein
MGAAGARERDRHDGFLIADGTIALPAPSVADRMHAPVVEDEHVDLRQK